MEIITAQQALEEAKGMTFEKMWAMMMEDRKRADEDHKRREEDHKQMDEDRKETERIIKDLSKNIGGISNTLGKFTEAMVSMKLRKKFNALGFTFIKQSQRTQFYEGDKVIAEVDFFLENGDYAMLIEVKTELNDEYINDHLERMETVRRCLDARNDERKLVGAVAGAIIPESALNYAHRKGLFVIAQNGESFSIAKAPEGFKAREW